MKINNFKHFYMAIAFCFCSILAIAQPKVETVIHSDPVGHPIPPELGNCYEGVEFAVYVANLELLTEISIGDGDNVLFLLPEDVPDLFIELIISDFYSSVSELSFFEFSHEEDGVNIYKSSIFLEIPNGVVDWTMRLLREIDGDEITDPDLPEGYGYYPMLEYSSEGNLFPCGLMHENGNSYWFPLCVGDCSEVTPECYNSIGIFSGLFHCNISSENFGGELIQVNNTDHVETSENLLEASNNFINSQFTPNPFSSNISFSFDYIDEGTIDIELFNVNRQVVQRWKRDGVKGKNYFNLLVNEIPSGVYFIKYSDGKDSSIKKMIRM